MVLASAAVFAKEFTNTSQQVEQVKTAMNVHPDAIVLAACNTASLATASTDNVNADR